MYSSRQHRQVSRLPSPQTPHSTAIWTVCCHCIVLPQDELQRQRAQLRECSGVSPAQLLQEQQFRAELKER